VHRPGMPSSRHVMFVHMSSTGGHREDYQRVLSDVFGLESSLGNVSARNFVVLVRAKALLFGSLDDDVRGFVLIALARMLTGKRTVGLFLRPQSCFAPPGLQSALKRSIFHLLTKLRSVSVCTILPFEVEPNYREVATYGLADPQLWDRSILPFQPSSEFGALLKEVANGRRIMAFIGTASPFKGVEQILKVMEHPEWDDSVCVVFAGRIPEETAHLVHAAQELGAVVFPRFISNAELDALYGVADFIWAGYQPGYDQASGNFGRAMQAGKIPVVRKDTLIEQLALLSSYPVIAIDFDDLRVGIARIQGPMPRTDGAPVAQISKWEAEFIETMAKSL